MASFKIKRKATGEILAEVEANHKTIALIEFVKANLKTFNKGKVPEACETANSFEVVQS